MAEGIPHELEGELQREETEGEIGVSTSTRGCCFGKRRRDSKMLVEIGKDC